jgi:carboxypeptidase C (cathepsin A)
MKRTRVRTITTGAVLALSLSAPLKAQQPAKDAQAAEAKTPDAKSSDSKGPSEEKPKEESSLTEHTLRLGGSVLPYRAAAATLLLKDDKGEPTGSLFYIAYTRSDLKDLSRRPLAFVYNGGPGSSSVWLHMGAFGPRRVMTSDAQATPPAPYKVSDNENSLLDKTDLVFVDPIGTGFSHAVGKAKDKDFWGIDEDVKSLAQFIASYVSRNNRWNSPKFLIGESYGTFRSAALSNYLQSRENMDFNGIVLISSVLDLGTISFNPGQDLPYILYLPSYAATAWYHKVLKDRPADLTAFLADARRFAATDYTAALMKGSALPEAEKVATAKKLSQFTGLSEDYVQRANLRVTLGQFMKELQRSRELITGRLDARFSGRGLDLLGEFAEYDPQDRAISSAFTAAFNAYVRDELKFGQDKTYKTGNDDAGQNWSWKRHAEGTQIDELHGEGFPGSPNVEGDLIQALVANPHLQVQVENGIYDLATPFFGTEYTMDHLGLPDDLRKHIHLEYYEAGHMMYVREPDLTKLKTNVGTFIDDASRH